MSDAIATKKVYSPQAAFHFLKPYLNMTVVSTDNDTSLVRVGIVWVAPDPFKSSSGAGIRLSNYRYWSINGILKAGSLKGPPLVTMVL